MAQGNFSPTIGHTHGDTEAFDDVSRYSIGPGSNVKIYKIKVWYSDMVHGLKVWYDVNGHHHSSKHRSPASKGKPSQEIHLDHDEFITHFGGRSGNVIDALLIRTNKGKEINTGGSGGNEFTFNIPPGHTVGAVRGGKNGHLHNISVYIVPAFGPPVKLPEQGGKHGDTRAFDDIAFVQQHHGHVRI
jgi:hypothetical protein